MSDDLIASPPFRTITLETQIFLCQDRLLQDADAGMAVPSVKPTSL